MTKSWNNIRIGFIPELQNEWESLGFGFNQVKEWIDAGLEMEDAFFADYLRKKGYVAESYTNELSYKDIKNLRKEHKDEEDAWKNIHPQFTKKLTRKWRSQCFTYDETKELVDFGYHPTDYDLIIYTLDVLKYDTDDILYHGDKEKLRKQYQEYLEKQRDWKKIDPDFLQRQKIWEKEGFNYQEARQWAEIGFSSYDQHNVKQWKKLGLTCEQVKLWKEQSFYYSEAERWINAGLGIEDADFASWLKHWKGYEPKEFLDCNDKEELREEMKKWKNIHKNFVKYPQIRKDWESRNFTYKEIKKWIESGLNTFNYRLAFYLKRENYAPEWVEKYGNMRKLLKEYEDKLKEIKDAQSYLDYFYPLEKRSEVKEINFYNETIRGDLKIENFINLKIFHSFSNSISDLMIVNCPQLEKVECIFSKSSDYSKSLNLTIIDCPNINTLDFNETWVSDLLIINSLNKVFEINFLGSRLKRLDFLDKLDPQKLISLNISSNDFLPQELSIFNKFTKLEILDISYNPFFGSLETLKNLRNLRKINITDTNINEGLGHLPYKFSKLSLGYLSDGKAAERNKGCLEIYKEIQTNEDYTYLGFGLEYYDNKEDNEVEMIYDIELWREYQPASLWLKEELAKIDPDVDVYDFNVHEFLRDHNVFFNIVTKTFEFDGDLRILNPLLQEINKTLFNEKERQINLLELHIQELTHLIKKHKEKIVNAYLYFASEKELLQELVKSYLEFAKLKKQETNSDDYGDQCEELEEKYQDIKKKLRKKLNKEEKGEMERILTDCGELVSWELELEQKLNSKQLLIEDKKQLPPTTITNNQDSVYFSSRYNTKQITDSKELITQLKAYSKLTEKHSQLITHQVINKIEKTTENTDKIFSTPKRPLLEKKIGQGRYGEVYRSKWGLQEVAVKKLYLLPHDTSESNLKDIQKEINILKNLRNRYIIQYYNTYSDDQELFIIMDYAENGTLNKFINDNKYKEHDWNFNANLIKQITLGLAYIHHENIIHRDLKSMNILLTYGYQAKISDFGLSKIKNITSSQSNDAKGTTRWMAPEVIREQEYSEQSDIYSLGMVIWEIATKCTKPFKEVDNDFSVMFKVAHENKKETIPQDTPENIQFIIKQCWKDNPNKRIILENILKTINKTTNQNTASEESDLITKTKRQLSLVSQNKNSQSESELVNFDELTEEPEPTGIDNHNWTNINTNFTPRLINQWQTHHFTPFQTRNWINIGLQPTDSHFASWLRDELHLEPLEVLNNMNSENNYQEADLREQFQAYRQAELQKLHSQLQLAQAKKTGQVLWESWETPEGLEKWINELKEKINKLETQKQFQTQQEQPPK
ncbi:MAG: protein kinase [Candidatus Moeniiplasma glomeromycotorum]|nr:protein kinase [Candidatus Moeniiplasma glomeromycotorum]MCE8167770.1 protein kinase [Candidatus Moeniiplasma glomeromycotorum]MCE8169169.1 protein kinase [Candidatus Moeniiplasma glomeromycotorum]